MRKAGVFKAAAVCTAPSPWEQKSPKSVAAGDGPRIGATIQCPWGTELVLAAGRCGATLLSVGGSGESLHIK